MPSSEKAKKILKARQKRNKEKGYPVGPSDVDVEYGDIPGERMFANDEKNVLGYVSPKAPKKIRLNPNRADDATDETLEDLLAHELIHTAQYQQAKEIQERGEEDVIRAHENPETAYEDIAKSNIDTEASRREGRELHFGRGDHEYRRMLNSIMYPRIKREAPKRSFWMNFKDPTDKEKEEIPKSFDIRTLIKYAKEAKVPFADIVDARVESYLMEHDKDYRDAHNESREIQNTDDRSFIERIKGKKREYPPATKTYKSWFETVEKKKKEQEQREKNERKRSKK